jgi:hypothetical protein
LSEYAEAFVGMPQALEGIGIVRVVPAAMYGPPKGPLGLRVSMTRHGATVSNWSAGGGAETVNACVTGAAAAYIEFPGWLAVIEQMPTATMVTMLPDTVHTEVVVEVKLTVRPELAVALIANGPTPTGTLLRGPKVMVCGVAPLAALTVKL